MDQVVSNGKIKYIEQNNTVDDLNKSSLIINIPKNDTNKIIRSSMEPFLNLDKKLTTNLINDLSNIEVIKEISNNAEIIELAKENKETIKSSLSLNLNESELPKNKTFLESADDQIINKIFFQTITNTPTNDDETFPEIVFPELAIKAEEEDSIYTDSIGNYQDNEPNQCSLNDNFDENYCSFNSTELQPTALEKVIDSLPCNLELTNTEEYEKQLFAMQLKNQKPSIVVDFYDDTQELEGSIKKRSESKMENYCFYFDQTIEEDEDEDIKIPGYQLGFENLDSVLDNNTSIDIELVEEAELEHSISEDDVSSIGVSNEKCMSVNVSSLN